MCRRLRLPLPPPAVVPAHAGIPAPARPPDHRNPESTVNRSTCPQPFSPAPASASPPVIPAHAGIPAPAQPPNHEESPAQTATTANRSTCPQPFNPSKAKERDVPAAPAPASPHPSSRRTPGSPAPAQPPNHQESPAQTHDNREPKYLSPTVHDELASTSTHPSSRRTPESPHQPSHPPPRIPSPNPRQPRTEVPVPDGSAVNRSTCPQRFSREPKYLSPIVHVPFWMQDVSCIQDGWEGR